VTFDLYRGDMASSSKKKLEDTEIMLGSKREKTSMNIMNPGSFFTQKSHKKKMYFACILVYFSF